MKTKAMKAEIILANTIVQQEIQWLIEEPTSELSDGTKTALQNIYRKLEKHSQNLINPALKKPRKRKPAAPASVDTGGSEPKANHVPDRFYGTRRGRNGGA